MGSEMCIRDRITAVEPDGVHDRAQVMRELAQSMADGAVMGPGPARPGWALVAYQPDGNAPQVHLNNDGLLIVAS